MTEPRIRSYRSTDQPLVERFFREGWRSTRFPFDPDGAHSDILRIHSEYQVGGGGFWLLWQEEEEIIGAVALRPLSGKTAEVKRLNVLPGYRGRGYGERLLRHALEHAAAERFQAVRLDTLRTPGPAVHLFEKYGFAEIPRYNSNPDAELFMELELPGRSASDAGGDAG